MDMHATDYRLLTKITLFNAQQADALYKEFLYRQYTRAALRPYRTQYNGQHTQGQCTHEWTMK